MFNKRYEDSLNLFGESFVEKQIVWVSHLPQLGKTQREEPLL
jgi:hypothetical protein